MFRGHTLQFATHLVISGHLHHHQGQDGRYHDQHHGDDTRIAIVVRLERRRIHVIRGILRISAGTALGQHQNRVKCGQAAHDLEQQRGNQRVPDLGDGDTEELTNPTGAIDGSGLIQSLRNGTDSPLIQQCMEGSELPQADEHQNRDGRGGVTEDIAVPEQPTHLRRHAEVRIEHGAPGNGNGRAGQQIWNEVDGGIHRTIPLPARRPGAKQQ